jgi:serine O-acetyltransferase
MNDAGDSGRLDAIVRYAYQPGGILRRVVRLLLRVVLHLEVPLRHFERGLRLVHPYNVIIHPDATMGEDVVIYHNVTLAIVKTGRRKGVPSVGNGVTIYPNAILVGGVVVGDNAVIGPGSVVTCDVPPEATVAGNPARPVATRPETPRRDENAGG